MSSLRRVRRPLRTGSLNRDRSGSAGKASEPKTYEYCSVRTRQDLYYLSIGSGARVLVARSIFTVGAKRCRRTEVLIRTQISIQLRILTQLAPNVTVGAKRFRYTEVSFQPGYRCNMKRVVYIRKEQCDHRLCPRTFCLVEVLFQPRSIGKFLRDVESTLTLTGSKALCMERRLTEVVETPGNLTTRSAWLAQTMTAREQRISSKQALTMGCSPSSHHAGMSAPTHHVQMSTPTHHAGMSAPTHLSGLSTPTHRTSVFPASHGGLSRATAHVGVSAPAS